MKKIDGSIIVSPIYRNLTVLIQYTLDLGEIRWHENAEGCKRIVALANYNEEKLAELRRKYKGDSFIPIDELKQIGECKMLYNK